jgi:hypothetical protein
MTIDEAIDEAIESLSYEAEETYEQSEIDSDPELQEWLQKKYEAIRVLKAMRTRLYTTQPAESLHGIALRQLGDEDRWVQIRDLNCSKFPDMKSWSYYPVGSVIKLPGI